MAEADNSRALGHAAATPASRSASRRMALQRPVAFGTPDLPCVPLSPNLHPTSTTINNIELFGQNALRRKSRNRQSFRKFAGPALCQDRSLSFRRAFVWPPLACVGLASVGLFSEAAAGSACGRLAVGLGGRAARQPTNCQLVNQAEQK